MARQLALALALVFTAFFAGLTLYVIARHGLDVLTLVSLLVLALFGAGLYGALTHPPDE
jgi:hypothetical protein